MTKYIRIALVLSLTGCSSVQKIETQYFLLTPTTNKPSVITQDIGKLAPGKVIIVEPIILAEYLDQPGIVLQTDRHEIKVSHYNLWAEPLKRNIHRFIIETLSTENDVYSFQTETRLTRSLNPVSLSIQINQFIGSESGTAKLSGYWTLKEMKLNKIMQTRKFNYEVPLEKNGYSELVTQLANLLEILCRDIAKSL